MSECQSDLQGHGVNGAKYNKLQIHGMEDCFTLNEQALREYDVLTVLHPAEAGSPAYRTLGETKRETSFSPRGPNTTYRTQK